jgi:hypothetical protein
VARIVALTQAARVARPRWWPVGLAWGLWALAMLGIVAVLWFDHLMRQAGRADLVQLNASGVPFLLALVSAPTVGAVLAGRRPRHPVGWLLLGLGLSIGLSGFIDGYAPYGLLARPGSLLAARWAAIYSPAMTVAGIACLGFVLLLSPTGSLPSPRWRWWARVAAAAPVLFLVAVTLEPEPLDPAYRSVTNPIGLQALQLPIALTDVLASGITVAGVVVGALSLVVRFRRAHSVERQQLRWVALAAVLASLAILVVLAGMGVGSEVLISWVLASVSPSCRWRSAPRSPATGCMTWTGSSAAPWPTGWSRCCSASGMPGWCSGWADCCPRAPAWPWPPRPWPWRRCSNRPAAASSRRSTAASTAAATTPPAPSPPSATGSATRSTWRP